MASNLLANGRAAAIMPDRAAGPRPPPGLPPAGIPRYKAATGAARAAPENDE